MGWLDEFFGRLSGTEPSRSTPEPGVPAPPTTEDLLTAVEAVEARVAASVPSVITARVRRVSAVVHEMAPRLDRLGAGSQQAHTVVATATSYLPEAVNNYARLPREFANTRPVNGAKPALYVLCDQLDLLTNVLGQISDAVSRQDAVALVAHGMFLQEKFGSSGLSLPALPTPPQPGSGTGSGPGSEGDGDDDGSPALKPPEPTP
ncbi:hypothetical protein [Antribacter gilvus]|uniref:hypothetical protein n=1 Tax=Antribacter gilvus TaxID=2304675 RepID=UPI00198026E9|nr:hypothetical protein [Antribacter gilvus]